MEENSLPHELWTVNHDTQVEVDVEAEVMSQRVDWGRCFRPNSHEKLQVDVDVDVEADSEFTKS